jgi:hypothetical protein
VPTLLAEARKYRVGLVLAHQFLSQFGKPDDPLLAAVRNCTNLKAVFRLRDNNDAADLAEMVVPLDLEMPVEKLIQPKVVGQRVRIFNSESVSDQESVTDMATETQAESVSVTESYIESLAETFAEGESTASSTGISLVEGASQSSMSSAASGASTSQMMTPAMGWMETPAVLGTTEGTSALTQSAQGSVASSMSGQNTATATGKNSMHAVAVGSAHGETISRGTARAKAIGKAITKGTAVTRGAQEGLEPIMADLPSAVHSKENVLYMAAQTLRNLTTGTAFINFVDASGMKAALLAVPDVKSYAPAPEDFERLRVRVLEASPSASRAEGAYEIIIWRKKALIELAQRALRPPEPTVPADFRVKKSRPAPEPKSPTEYRTTKERPSKEKKDKS